VESRGLNYEVDAETSMTYIPPTSDSPVALPVESTATRDDNASQGMDQSSVKPPASRKKQFRFGPEPELTLLRSVCAVTPWEAPHGKTQATWTEISRNLQSSGLNIDGKRVRAKFETSIRGWKEKSAEEERQSGIDAEYGDKEALLEDIKAAMDDWNTAGRATALAAQKAKDKEEIEGRDLREASMAGLTMKRDTESDGDSGNEAIQPLSKRKRATISTYPFVQAFNSLADLVKTKLYRVARQELALQERKMALEERRLEFEMEERVAARRLQDATTNAMLNLIAKYADQRQKK
jgi:hypothetical protein